MRLPDPLLSRAVLMGTAHYDDDRLPALPGVYGNVRDLASVLTDEGWGAFDARGCTSVVDPINVSKLGESVADVAEQAQDTLLVYYAGHGLLDSSGELFLALSSTNSSRIAYTAMPFAFVRRAFLESPAANRVLILDCCFSGRAIEAMTDSASVVAGQIDIAGVYTLTSAPANQPANAPAGESHTAFTGELLHVLQHGIPDQAELITLEHLYRHLLARLNARGLPRPQRRSTNTSERLALARNRGCATAERAERTVEPRPRPVTPVAKKVRRSVGISFGCTNTTICVLADNDVPFVVPSRVGASTTPSMVGFTEAGQVLVGQAARDRAMDHPDRTITSVKRHLGTDWKTVIDGQAYSAQEISARVLMKVKRDAESFLNEVIKDAVLTVPAHFDDAQRRATREAAEIAGLNVLRIASEPTTVAAAYAHGQQLRNETVVVLNLGGGGFDVSVVDIDGRWIRARASGGGNYPNGDDWHLRIEAWLLDRFKTTSGIDLNRDPAALRQLQKAAERAKMELTSAEQTIVSLPDITTDADGVPVSLTSTLARKEFQRITGDLVESLLGSIHDVVKTAGRIRGHVRVLLAGRAAAMPAIADAVRAFTGGHVHCVNPDEVAAVGAALQAGVLAGQLREPILVEVNPASIGVETKGGAISPLIGRNVPIPARHSEIFSTTERNQPEITIPIYQGDRGFAADIKQLGVVELTEIPPLRRGLVRVEVTVDVNVDGITQVWARNLGPGGEPSFRRTGPAGLSSEDITKLTILAEEQLEDRDQSR